MGHNTQGRKQGREQFGADVEDTHCQGPALAQHHLPRGAGGPRWRWLVSLRAAVVVLAMVAAALGVLWMESAGVQGAMEQLETNRGVDVPPLGSSAVPSDEAGQGLSGDPPTTPPVGAVAATAGTLAGSSTSAPLVIHVAGAVTTPGIFLLPAGSRVFQAVDAAGGALPTAELAALNLAAELSDGTQVFIPTAGQDAAPGANPGALSPPGAPDDDGAGGGAGTAKALNLNTASAQQLEELPGLGPVLAGRIVKWRTDHGPFASVEGLQAVPGVGAKLLAGLSGLVVVP